MPQQRRNTEKVGGGTQKKSAAVTAPVTAGALEPAAALADIADTLYRAAAAACAEHSRHAGLVKHRATEIAQKKGRTAVRAFDEVLDEAVDLYELACLKESNHAGDAWWHKANMLWRAAKEYLRHVVESNRLSRGGNDHGRAELVELSIEYELEASALLRLRHAMEAYKAARPGVV